MDDRVSAIWEEFNHLEVEHRMFRFATTQRGLQANLVAKLGDLYERSVALKLEVVRSNDEDSANALLCLASVVDAFRSEILMWLALRDEDAHLAWENLLRARDLTRVALQAHLKGKSFESDFERLQMIEHLVFPPQRYTSLGLVAKGSKCSICAGEYGECGHVSGRAYMGELCGRTLTDIEIREISFVFDPANKHARITAISDGGVMRDTLTGEPSSSEESTPRTGTGDSS